MQMDNFDDSYKTMQQQVVLMGIEPEKTPTIK